MLLSLTFSWCRHARFGWAILQRRNFQIPKVAFYGPLTILVSRSHVGQVLDLSFGRRILVLILGLFRSDVPDDNPLLLL